MQTAGDLDTQCWQCVNTTTLTTRCALTDFQTCPSRGCRECFRCKHAFTGSAAALAHWAEPRALDTGEQLLLCADSAFTVAHCRHLLIALQIRQRFTQQRIYIDALASCKALVGMLAEHGSEHDAVQALQMFGAFVKVQVTQAELGNLPTSMVLSGRATVQRLTSATED